jgi:hypothetical protein
MRQEATEATIAAVANKVSVSGGAAAVWGGMTANEIAAFGGLLIAVIGLLVQIYYKRKADKRGELLLKKQLSELEE